MSSEIENWNSRISGVTEVHQFSLRWRKESRSYGLTVELCDSRDQDNTVEFELDGVTGIDLKDFDGYLMQAMQLRFSRREKGQFTLADLSLIDDLQGGRLKIVFDRLVYLT